MKFTQKLYVHACRDEMMRDGRIDYKVSVFDHSDDKWWGPVVHTKDVEFEFDAPSESDVRNGMIRALKVERQSVLADAQIKVNKLDQKISKLLAIEAPQAA